MKIAKYLVFFVLLTAFTCDRDEGDITPETCLAAGESISIGDTSVFNFEGFKKSFEQIVFIDSLKMFTSHVSFEHVVENCKITKTIIKENWKGEFGLQTEFVHEYDQSGVLVKSSGNKLVYDEQFEIVQRPLEIEYEYDSRGLIGKTKVYWNPEYYNIYEYSYNSDSLLEVKKDYDTEIYTYDENGNIITIIGLWGEVNNTYDNSGRILTSYKTSEHVPYNFNMDVAYDQEGRIIQMNFLIKDYKYTITKNTFDYSGGSLVQNFKYGYNTTTVLSEVYADYTINYGSGGVVSSFSEASGLTSGPGYYGPSVFFAIPIP
ncbi:hypothetical protein [Marinigracilibium pacificum]|uniref:Teneurin-like YD-shell domain-containing protein n=1 Tax=Marinigracilibium pacificum TaxID=2729599 RepID=A0A848IZ88_9BACT|nr:hypothetical protein [Marinigracilibium pacificum]NMM48946.1 hypothetical protein [Marinigracilibium pacificum]